MKILITGAGGFIGTALSKFLVRDNAEYVKKGYIETPLGFRYYWGKNGLMTGNNKKNSPIQGTAFHRVLWAIPRINIEFNNKKFKSIIIGQIHDSIVVDLDIKEVYEVMDIIDEYMLCTAWDWDDIVNKEIEYKIGTDFYNMKEI